VRFGSPNSSPNTWIADLADLELIVRILCALSAKSGHDPPHPRFKCWGHVRASFIRNEITLQYATHGNAMANVGHARIDVGRRSARAP